MKTRNTFYVTLAVLVVIGGASAWLLQRDVAPAEPVFEGKPLTAWLEELYQMMAPRTYSVSMGGPGAKAVRAMGTNAVPYLVHLLTANRRRLTDKPALWAKNEAVLPIAYTTARERVLRATVACGLLGPKARAAIPALIPLLEDPDWQVREQVVTALCFIQQDADLVVPLLALRLADTNATVQLTAATGLTMFGAKAKSARPALQKLAQSPYPFLSAPASNALYRIEIAPE